MSPVQLLERYGYAYGVRAEQKLPEGIAERMATYGGQFIIYDPDGGPDGFCIVGDNLQAMCKEAAEALDLDDLPTGTKRILIIVEGGVVQDVFPAEDQIEFAVLDWDNTGEGNRIDLPDWALAMLDDDCKTTISDHNKHLRLEELREKRFALDTPETQAGFATFDASEEGDELRELEKALAITNCEECARSFGPHYTGPCEH